MFLKTLSYILVTKSRNDNRLAMARGTLMRHGHQLHAIPWPSPLVFFAKLCTPLEMSKIYEALLFHWIFKKEGHILANKI